jgi:hypothetical protein
MSGRFTPPSGLHRVVHPESAMDAKLFFAKVRWSAQKQPVIREKRGKAGKSSDMVRRAGAMTG